MIWIFHPRGPFNWQGIGRNNLQLQDTRDIERFRSSINSEVGLSCGPSWLHGWSALGRCGCNGCWRRKFLHKLFLHLNEFLIVWRSFRKLLKCRLRKPCHPIAPSKESQTRLRLGFHRPWFGGSSWWCIPVWIYHFLKIGFDVSLLRSQESNVSKAWPHARPTQNFLQGSTSKFTLPPAAKWIPNEDWIQNLEVTQRPQNSIWYEEHTRPVGQDVSDNQNITFTKRHTASVGLQDHRVCWDSFPFLLNIDWQSETKQVARKNKETFSAQT